MDVAEILIELERRGATIHLLDRGRLGVRPKSVLDDELREKIRDHKDQILAAVRGEVVLDQGDQALSPFGQLQIDWRDAIKRAQAGFAENAISPDHNLLEATAVLEMKAIDWRRMDAAHLPQAARQLELLGAVYAGRLTASLGADGKVSIRAWKT